jgi:glutathione S-transferase
VRRARSRYWAARERGDPEEIDRALREWVNAQASAAERELETRGWVVEERLLPEDG